MIFRIVFMFVILAAATSGLLYLATCTPYFNATRLKLIARNAALLAAGGVIALVTIGLLVVANA